MSTLPQVTLRYSISGSQPAGNSGVNSPIHPEHSGTNSDWRTGKVFLVGAGPGAPDLLTIKAHRLLREADAIVHDYLVAPEIMALARTDAECVFVGKKGGGFCCPQRNIEETLIRLAREGKRVVR